MNTGAGGGGGVISTLVVYICAAAKTPSSHLHSRSRTYPFNAKGSLKSSAVSLLFIPYRSSARSGLGSFFKLENAQTFRSEALLEPMLESHPTAVRTAPNWET